MKTNLTEHQQEALTKVLLTTIDNFCMTSKIDSEKLNGEQWEILRNQIVDCLQRIIYLLGGDVN
jgi:hypothetical protein